MFSARRNSLARSRRGFTLVEAMVAISIAAMASVALVLGMLSAVQNTDEATDQSMALGIAEQIADEVAGCRYAAPGAGAYQTGLGPNTYETGGHGRERYDDIDDFISISVKPPQDPYGYTLGNENGAGGERLAAFRAPTVWLANWRSTIDIYYVSNTDPSVKLTGSSTSNFRAVEVAIYETKGNVTLRQLAKVRRVFGYVPGP